MNYKPIKRIFATIIVFTIVLFIGRNVVALFMNFIEEDTSIFSIVRSQFCIKKVYIPEDLSNKNLIVLRLDDVQAYSWRDISIQMIRDAYKFNAPTVAGVIPEKLADDRRMVQFLKRENCNIELAMHGWNHFGTPSETAKLKYITEFGDIGYDEARDKIIKAKKVLEPIINRKIISFIPPYNVVGTDSIRAIHDEGINVISALGTGVFDYHATTYNFDEKRTMSPQEVVSSCDDVFKKNGLCVIMLHPQDFANPDKTIDKKSYDEIYIKMLTKFSERNDVFVTFEELAKRHFFGL